MNVKKAAGLLSNMGRGGDTLLAHINPKEAALLKAAGGSGKVNPKTGLLEFDDGGDGGGDGGDGGDSGDGADSGGDGGLGGGLGGFGGFGLGGSGGLSGIGSVGGFGNSGFGGVGGFGSGFGGLGGFGGSSGGYGGYGPGIGTGKVGMGSAAANAALGGGPSAITGGNYGSRSGSPGSSVESLTADLYGQMNAPNADLTSLAQALGDVRMGNVKGLADAGYTNAASELTKSYSAKTDGLLGLVKSMFSSEQPETVNTPQRAISDALQAGYMGVKNGVGELALTPKAYAAMLGLPVGMIATAVNPMFGGLLAASLNKISAPSNAPSFGVSDLLGAAPAAAGMLGMTGLAQGLGYAKNVGKLGGYVNNAVNLSRASDFAGTTPDAAASTQTGPLGGGNIGVSELAGTPGFAGNEAAVSQGIDPMAWYKAKYWT